MTMTTENHNTVTLTAEQYAQTLYFTHFVKQLCCFVDESSVDIAANAITPMLFCAAADFEKSLGVTIVYVE